VEAVMKACREIRYLLPDFVSNRSNEEENESVQEHLEHCSPCREEVLLLKQAFEAVASSRTSIPPEAYWTNFLPRLHDRLSDGRKTGRELAPLVNKFLLPSAGLVVTILLLSLTGVVPEPKRSLLAERQLVRQMDTTEFYQLAESSLDPLFPESSSRLEALLPQGDETRRAINSLIAPSSDEVVQLREGGVRDLTDTGLDDLTDEEMELVLQRLGSGGTL
jgi:hypothetical protein